MKFFCSLPFTTIYVGPNNNITPCCNFMSNKKLTVNNYFSDNEMQSVKQQLLDNIAPLQCKKCVNEESLAGHSLRIIMENHNSKEEEIRLANTADYFNIVEAHIATSNVCNLLCLPCYTGSYVRSVELSKLGLINYTPLLNTTTFRINDIPNLNNITKLTLLGGEPFADKETIILINELINSGKSKNIELFLNTNLTLVTEDMLLTLKNNFNKILIKGSIDGIGLYNDYLRYPSTWQHITDAVSLIKKFEIPFLITTAMSNLALIHYDKLIEWGTENNIIDMFVSNVVTPAELNYNRLPTAMKLQLLNKYKNLLISYNGTEQTKSVIKMCITILSTPGCSDAAFARTLKWLEKHDTLRGTNFRNVWPELS